MSRRIDRVNKHIQRTFGEILQTEADLPKEVLVTVSGVETTHNLRSATVWLSVLPGEAAEITLQGLKKQMYELQGSLNRQLKLKILPRIYLKIDKGAAYAEKINRELNNLA
ncbi:MAG: ribosome-binding factor A [bacterium]